MVVGNRERFTAFADETELPEDRLPHSNAFTFENDETGTFSFALPYRQPYRFGELLAFFRTRQLEGVETIDDLSYARSVLLEKAGASGEDLIGWIRVTDDRCRSQLNVQACTALEPAAAHLKERLRRQFDTDADPQAIDEAIGSVAVLAPNAVTKGTRVPGAFDPFEITVRAVLGQQIAVKAANKLAARIASTYGIPFDSGIDGITRLFPTAYDFLTMNPIETALGVLGVLKTRSRAIQEIARLTVEGHLDLSANADAQEQMHRLLAIKGIGPWSANYIAMRALHYADAFLETDAGVKHALPHLTPRERLDAAEAWRPYRSYANICLWNSLG